MIRTADAAMSDRLPGLAAEIAFWALLSLPALILTTIAVAGVIGGVGDADWQAQLVERVVEVSRVALTEQAIDTAVEPVLQRLIEGGGVGVVSFAFLATVWAASRAVKVVLTTMTIVYDRPGHRSTWQDRLIGFAITFGALLAGIVILPLLIAGPDFADQLEDWFATDLNVLAGLWRSLYWPTVVIVATLTIAALYHLGVPGRTTWRRSLPGAVLATAVWLAGSGGLRLYGTWIAGTDSVYGPLAGPIVALLWIWVTGFAVLLGAELNAQIERLWPADAVDATGELLERAADDDLPIGRGAAGPPSAVRERRGRRS